MSSTGPTDPANLGGGHAPTFHHIGLVVGSIAEVVEDFAKSVYATWDGKVILDPLQVVRVTFVRPSLQLNPAIELIEPAGEDSPVLGFLKRGGGLHHLCYEVDGLEQQLQSARSAGMLIAKPPQPAVAFGGRRIAWVYTKNRLLLEFLER